MNSIENKDLITEREEKLLRKGSLLNTLGVWRFAAINKGNLERDRYIKLIKINFMMSIDEQDPIFENQINLVWDQAIEKLTQMNLLDLNATTKNKIVLIDNKLR